MWLHAMVLLVACLYVSQSFATHGLQFPTCSTWSHMSYNGTRLGSPVRNGTLEDCCSNCTINEQCDYFSFHPVGTEGQPTWCVLNKADGNMSAVGSNFTVGRVTEHILCYSNADCTLAGECVNGKCICDGWTHGDHCEVLNLTPADPDHFGYLNSSGYSSWGGASIESNGTWYLFASQIAGKCPLSGHWSKSSEVVRGASSQGPMGPFDNIEVILPPFAHNVKPFLAPDGTWLLYYIGQPDNSTANCSLTGSSSRDQVMQYGPSQKQSAGPIMIASAARPDAAPEEWTVHGPITDSFGWHSATNPSPIFFPNGSVLLAVSRRWYVGPQSSIKTTYLMHADNWRGPYHNITKGFNDSIKSGEDPDIFRTKRGFHMLNHNAGAGATRFLFSSDGFHWEEAVGLEAFNETVVWTNGSTTELGSRQRPQIVFANDGMPGWLWTGVSYGSSNTNTSFTFTFAQEIYRT